MHAIRQVSILSEFFPMGSYLTIVNDTEDTWQCHLGPDMKAFNIGGMIAFVIGSIAGAIGFAAGSAVFVSSFAAAGMIHILGIPVSSLVAITTAALPYGVVGSVIGGASGFSIAVAKGVSVLLNDRGYESIPPGGTHRFGRMTLSLWQQAECIRTTVNTTTIVLDKLYMRPIFSGSTINSNRNHTIQFWLNKHGTEIEVIKGESERSQRVVARNQVTTRYVIGNDTVTQEQVTRVHSHVE